MASDTERVWTYNLAGYGITTDDQRDCRAIVSCNKSMTTSDVAHEVAEESTDLREDTLVLAMKLMEDKIAELVCRGYTVVTGNALYQPVIKGTFSSTAGDIDSEKNRPACSIRASSTLRQKVAAVRLEFSGYVQEAGGSRISQVVDAITGAADGTITAGGAITVMGKKIKCVGADGASAGVVRFVHLEDDGTEGDAVEAATLVSNAPKTLVVVCPTALVQGASYRLEVETYYSNASTLLSKARTISYSPLVVC